MPDLSVTAFWMTLILLVVHVLLLGLLSVTTLRVRRMLRDAHSAQREFPAFTKNSSVASGSSLRLPEKIMICGYVAVLILLTLSGASV